MKLEGKHHSLSFTKTWTLAKKCPTYIQPQQIREDVSETLNIWFFFENEEVQVSRVTTESESVTKGITNIQIERGSGMDGCLCIMYFHFLVKVYNQRLLFHQLSFIKNQEDTLRMCCILRQTKHFWKYSGALSKTPEITFVVFLLSGVYVVLKSFFHA